MDGNQRTKTQSLAAEYGVISLSVARATLRRLETTSGESLPIQGKENEKIPGFIEEFMSIDEIAGLICFWGRLGNTQPEAVKTTSVFPG